MLPSRFDSELSAVQEEVQRERVHREKLAREKDMLTGEVFSIRQQLEVSVSVVYFVSPSSDIMITLFFFFIATSA